MSALSIKLIAAIMLIPVLAPMHPRPSLGAVYIGIKGVMFVASNILKAFPRLASVVESLRLMIPGGA